LQRNIPRAVYSGSGADGDVVVGLDSFQVDDTRAVDHQVIEGLVLDDFERCRGAAGRICENNLAHAGRRGRADVEGRPELGAVRRISQGANGDVRVLAGYVTAQKSAAVEHHPQGCALQAAVR